MATCKYCGKSAGLLSRAHKECEEKHVVGIMTLRRLLEKYFQGTSSNVQIEVSKLRRENFINSNDIASEFGKALDDYTTRIRRPFSPQTPQIVTRLVAALGESFNSLDANGAISRFAQKLMKGSIAEYFTGHQNIASTQTAIHGIQVALPVSNDITSDTCYYMLDKAADNFLKDGLLTPQEDNMVNEYTRAFGIQPVNLPAKYQNGNIVRLTQAGILTGLQNGQLPIQMTSYPIVLAKSEVVLWNYEGVKMYEEKVQREYRGTHHGFSVRICKGVYYRPGVSRAKPVEHNYMNLEGTGSLYITNKNLIFNSSTRGVKIPYTKIIGLTPYSDGLELNRDGNAKRIVLQGFDSWFVMNVLSLVNNI